MCKLSIIELFNFTHYLKPLINTPCWSLLEIPEFFCLSLRPPHRPKPLYFSLHAYQPPAGLIVTFAQFCPEAHRNLLASFACKVQHAPLWVWGASRQPVPCGLPDLASQQPSLFPTCWGGAHILSTVLDIGRCCQSFPPSNWGQPSDKQQVGKDKYDPCRKRDAAQTRN